MDKTAKKIAYKFSPKRPLDLLSAFPLPNT